jgi:hypothetical membrane protein
VIQWVSRNLLILIGAVVLLPISIFMVVMTLAFGVGFAPEGQTFYGLAFLGAYCLVFGVSLVLALKTYRQQQTYGYWDILPILYFVLSFVYVLVE